MSAEDPRERWMRNPFFVLGVARTAPFVEIEREGRRILGLMELEAPGADAYDTPFGPRRRSAEEVREAMAELSDPERRALHELFAAAPSGSTEIGPDAGCGEAFELMGFGRR